MNTKILYHGSKEIIEKPTLRGGKESNDYGYGFYCTENIELANEWACPDNNDGYANKYELDMTGLNVLDLTRQEYNILNWMALLLQFRIPKGMTPNDEMTREYILKNFSIDLTKVDVIIGYRADDSYFSFAESFVQNGLPLRTLNQALRLGKLGEQTVLISEKAFENLKFEEVELADKTIYYPKFISRDSGARETYRNEIRKGRSYKDDIFVLDILREEMKNDDSRIQRILSK
jgi:hypothetical protein